MKRGGGRNLPPRALPLLLPDPRRAAPAHCSTWGSARLLANARRDFTARWVGGAQAALSPARAGASDTAGRLQWLPRTRLHLAGALLVRGLLLLPPLFVPVLQALRQ